MWQKSDSDLKFMLDALDTTEENFRENVSQIREWLHEQSDFPEIMDDDRIKNFLLISKCRVEKTKEKIEAYYTGKLTIKAIFENCHPNLPYLRILSEAIIYVPLPKLTEDKQRVFAFQIKDKDKADKLDVTYYFKFIGAIFESRLKNDIIYNDIFIIDCQNIGWKFCIQLTPRLMYNVVVRFYERICSFRMKACLLINVHPLVEKVIWMMKAFLKPKLGARFIVLPEPEMVKQHIPEDILPKNFGGTERSLEELQETFLESFAKDQEWFDYLESIREKHIRMQNEKKQ